MVLSNGAISDVFATLGFTRLNENDRALFNELCWRNASDSVDYSNCWSYLVQSTFFGGWKYVDGNCFIAATTRFPNKTPFVITKAIGENSKELALEFAEEFKKHDEKVIFKNIGVNEETFLRSRGLRDYSFGDCWDSRFKYDDDSFAQAIVDLTKLESLKGSYFKTLRYHINSFKKEHGVSIKTFISRRKKDALNIFSLWKKSFLNRYAKQLATNPLDAHSLELHETYLNANYSMFDESQGVFSFLLYVDGAPKAFTLAEKVSDTTVGVYSNISSNEFQGLSECLVYETLCACAKEGFSFANLGGSEFSTLHNFKKKFATSFIQKKHLVLY